MIDALYPGFTIECTRGPPRAHPAPGASRHPPAPPYPGRRPPSSTHLHPRSRHRPTSLSRLPSLSLLHCVFSRRGYPTLRDLRAILRKCAMRGATDSQLARNSQINPPRMSRTAGRRADGHAFRLSECLSLPQSTRSATSRPRISPRPTDAESPDPAGARLQAPARPTYTRGPAPGAGNVHARGGARLCFPSRLQNGLGRRRTPIADRPSTD